MTDETTTEPKPRRDRATPESMIGRIFGRWTVYGYSPKGEYGRRWMVRCTCGTESVTTANALTSGKSTSCGCLHHEQVAERNQSKRQHNEEHRAEFQVWRGMIDRCETLSSSSYEHYGARGIRVCERWRESFAAFLADMGSRPSSSHSIDRINNDGNYEPGNCRWATRAEQQRNRSDNHILTFRGRSMCVADWSAETGISKSAIDYRLSRNWPIERVLTEPMQLTGKAAAGRKSA